MIFNGKTALITGASRGIGRAIALAFAQQHVKRLILVARDGSRLAEVAAEVEALGVEAIVLPLDLSQSIEVHSAIARAWRDYGPISLLVNCAGIAYQAPFLNSQTRHIEAEVATNLLGTYTMTRLLARRMASQRQGHIINVSSLMGKVAAPTMATYSATKFAIVGFSQALRSELAPFNVKVCTLLPSLTTTEMVQEFQGFRWVNAATPEQVAQSLISGLKRGSPEILVGWQSHLAVWCSRLVPRLLEQIVHVAAPTATWPHRWARLRRSLRRPVMLRLFSQA